MTIKPHLLRAITIATITVFIGNGIDYLTDLETTLGLDSLFHIRGTRQPPPEVVVVAMDEASENRLGAGRDLTRWRGFHAQLIQQLQTQGVALIVFDLQFITPHTDQDPAFAAAMRSAGNVLLTECVQKLRHGVEDFYGRDECSETNQKPFVQKEAGQDIPLSEQLIAMRKVPPTPILAKAALDHAPFSLPSDAENETIREAWTFLDPLAETPALPVVAWLHFLQRTGALQGISQATSPFSAWLTGQRRQCADNPAKALAEEPSGLASRLNAVICQGETRHLDFYGPPQTIRMESYSDVYDGKVANLKGKAVFIGKANRKFSPGKIDYFPTPFTDTHSGKMAGVEILATQFANILEGRFVASPYPPSLLLLIASLVLGVSLAQFAGFVGILLSLAISGLYAGLAVWVFNRHGMWLPIAVPLLVQLPLSWLISLIGSRRDLINERKRILTFVRRVFPQWIPLVSTSPGEWYPDQGTAQTATTQRDVCGICLATDIAGYTTISSQYTPHQMWELMNAYFQVLGQPVNAYKGIITDVAGDAMIAVWFDSPVAEQRLAACLTALEMQLAIDLFNQGSNLGSLPTRIGLNEGDMTLGRLDAGKGSHYSVIGDTVNTASRIQGVNKYLGTRILASATVAASLKSLTCRPVGNFRLVGREEPMELVEIVGKATPAIAAKSPMYKQFALGLSLFQNSQWPEASTCFQALLDQYGHDGPTRFYLDKALAYLKNPPSYWDGVVTLDAK